MTRWCHGYAPSEEEDIYWEFGGEGTPVVLCHGAGSNHVSFYQQMAGLASDRTQVIVWDQRGYGNSTCHSGIVGPTAAGRDLDAVLAKLGLGSAGIHLVGQAMGGMVAAAWAVANPGRALSLAIWDGPFGVSEDGRELIWTMRPDDGNIKANRQDPSVGKAGAVGLDFSERNPAQAYLYQTLQQLGNTRPGYRALFAALAKEPVAIEALAQLDIPILLGLGEQDPTVDAAAFEQLASLLPKAVVTVIPGAGHSPYFEVPEAWNAILRSHAGLEEEV